MTDPAVGIRSNAKLLAAGWERRYLAGPARAKEATETYEALGLEVLAEPLEAANFGTGCGDCSASVCESYVLIYTRKRQPVAETKAVQSQGGPHKMKLLQPPDWPRPKGYSNGVVASGTWICIAGQVGWDEQEQFPCADLVGQTRQALCNIVTVLAEAGAGPSDIVRLTWYVTDKRAYLDAQRELGQVYREVIGAHFPAMSLVVVAGLVEDGAVVEIEATAVKPEVVS